MSQVTLLGGVAEIGGNKVLVEDRDARVLIDFGMSLAARSKYFADPYASPRSESALLKLGIIPKIDGAYRWEKEAEIDAVILSHAHLDHYGYLSLTNREIPVYCGETTRAIMAALTEMRRATFESDYRGIVYKTFRTGDVVKIGSVSIKPVHVDHSIPGSYGLVIETSEGTVAYTGDMRAHGRSSQLTRDFVDSASKAEPSVLLTEATNMVGGAVSTEAEVQRCVGEVVERAPGLVMASFSAVDTDRLLSFYNAAQTADRKLALSMRQAYLLSKLQSDPKLSLPRLTDPGIVVYKRTKRKYEKWEEGVCEEGDSISASELAKEYDRHILAGTMTDMESLLEVRPPTGSAYLQSSSEPFNEEMELDMERLIGWLDYFGMPLYHVHVSGHMMPQELRASATKIAAKKTVPMHTEHPELFQRFFSEEPGKVLIPQKGIAIPV